MTSINLTKAYINLDNLSHNISLLQGLVGTRLLWPAIKANAYGHGMLDIARKLITSGYTTLCLAHVTEVQTLIQAGIKAKYIIMSATLPEHSKAIVESNAEPAICTMEMVEALHEHAKRAATVVPIHLMVDTGMGRVGIRSHRVKSFLEQCRQFDNVRVRGLMSHFPCADETDKSLSLQQIKRFRVLGEMVKEYGIEVCHMANSAAIFDLPQSHFDAVRPGIAIYGLIPSAHIQHPVAKQLKPVLSLKTKITFLKEVPAGTGLSYGHTFRTSQASLIATVPIGYGDGLHRYLSNQCDMLVQGIRCPQVGRITMDQTLLDITSLHNKAKLGDEVVVIGRQGNEMISADEIAQKLDTINYEVVTSITDRVPRETVYKNK